MIGPRRRAVGCVNGTQSRERRSGFLSRRGNATWATAGIAGAGVAITVGATVLLGSNPAINASSPNTGKVQMSSMQRDLSLTAAQTTARLKKETWASGTEAT